MKKIFCYTLAVAFLLFQFSDLQAQTTENDAAFEELANQLLDNLEEDTDVSEYLDEMYSIYQNPLNINEIEREELEKFLFLSDFQINALLNYLQKYGEIYSVYELQLIEGFSSKEIKTLLPFIVVRPKSAFSALKLSKMFTQGRSTLFLRSQTVLEQQAGYIKTFDEETNTYSAAYKGDPYLYYARYAYEYRNFSYGFTAENDAGEEFFKGSNTRGFDFYSGNIAFEDLGFIKYAVVGDYTVGFGQGLTMNRVNGAGKSAYVTNIRQKSNGVKKYSSTAENNFLRGAATTLQFGKINFTAFYSNSRFDANLEQQDTTEDAEVYVSSLQNTGFHRTESEITDKDAIRMMFWGANLTAKLNRMDIGATFVHSELLGYLAPDNNYYNKYYFSGSENFNASADYNLNLGNLFCFGEFAVSQNGGFAVLNGATFQLTSFASLAVLHRFFEAEYQTIGGSVFSETGTPRNENGLYLGLQLTPLQSITISAYSDSYRFPWLRSTTDAPSEGNDYFIETAWNPSQKINMTVRFKTEEKQENTAQETNIDYLATLRKTTLRYQFEYVVNDFITLKNRMEWSFYKKENTSEKGFLIYQDLKITPPNTQLTINLRYAIFDTDGYNSRIYAYENEVLYGYSIPAYYAKGSRWYAVLKYSFPKTRIDLWLRFAQTYYRNKTEISSGNQTIEGNTKSELKIQLRWRF